MSEHEGVHSEIPVESDADIVARVRSTRKQMGEGLIPPSQLAPKVVDDLSKLHRRGVTGSEKGRNYLKKVAEDPDIYIALVRRILQAKKSDNPDIPSLIADVQLASLMGLTDESRYPKVSAKLKEISVEISPSEQPEEEGPITDFAQFTQELATNYEKAYEMGLVSFDGEKRAQQDAAIERFAQLEKRLAAESGLSAELDEVANLEAELNDLRVREFDLDRVFINGLVYPGRGGDRVFRTQQLAERMMSQDGMPQLVKDAFQAWRGHSDFSTDLSSFDRSNYLKALILIDAQVSPLQTNDLDMAEYHAQKFFELVLKNQAPKEVVVAALSKWKNSRREKFKAQIQAEQSVQQWFKDKAQAAGLEMKSEEIETTDFLGRTVQQVEVYLNDPNRPPEEPAQEPPPLPWPGYEPSGDGDAADQDARSSSGGSATVSPTAPVMDPDAPPAPEPGPTANAAAEAAPTIKALDPKEVTIERVNQLTDPAEIIEFIRALSQSPLEAEDYSKKFDREWAVQGRVRLLLRRLNQVLNLPPEASLQTMEERKEERSYRRDYQVGEVDHYITPIDKNDSVESQTADTTSRERAIKLARQFYSTSSPRVQRELEKLIALKVSHSVEDRRKNSVLLSAEERELLSAERGFEDLVAQEAGVDLAQVETARAALNSNENRLKELNRSSGVVTTEEYIQAFTERNRALIEYDQALERKRTQVGSYLQERVTQSGVLGLVTAYGSKEKSYFAPVVK